MPSNLATWQKEALEGQVVAPSQLDDGDRVRAIYHNAHYGDYIIEGNVTEANGLLFVGPHGINLDKAHKIRLVKARPDAREEAVERVARALSKIPGAPSQEKAVRRIALAAIDALTELEEERKR